MILLFSATLLIQAQENGSVKWYTIDEALKLSKKKPKKIMIDVYTDWCGWCKKMDKETFNNPEIAKYLNENYYPVKFNAESSTPVTYLGKTYINEGNVARSSHQLAVALLNGQMSYPSIVFMDEKQQLITPVPGYRDAKSFEPLLYFIFLDKYKNNVNYDEYQKTFKGKVK